MASIRFKMSVNDADLKKLFEKVSIEVKKKARNNFGDLRPLIEEGIDEAVKDNSKAFIPSPDEIGELGIGEGGSPALVSHTAWRSLLASKKNGITVFTSRKKGTGNSRTIGEISISINEELFYIHPNSVIETESDELPIIPWMQWLMLGETISGSRFTTNDPKGFSRTGRGLMIDGGIWRFHGRGEEVFGRILKQSRNIIGIRLIKIF